MRYKNLQKIIYGIRERNMQITYRLKFDGTHAKDFESPLPPDIARMKTEKIFLGFSCKEWVNIYGCI